MLEEETRIFDRLTIFLSLLLIGLILIMGGLLLSKEKNIKTNIKFFNQFNKEKEFDEIIKNDKILISFSGPIQNKTVLENLKIEPKLNFNSKWRNSRQLELEIKENLVPDFRYNLIIEKFKSKWGITNKKKNKVFSTDPLPKIKSIKSIENQIEVKVDKKIVFAFEEVPADQYFLKIKTEPNFDFQIISSENKNEIIIKPIENLNFDTEYTLVAELKSQKYFDFSRTIKEFSFKTERPPVVVYGFDQNKIPTRTEIRDKMLDPVIVIGRYVDIDLTNQNLYIFENGQEKGAFKVSTGIRGMNTPTGEFKVMGKYTRPWSKTYGLFMPWFIQFTSQGHGIHELPEWPGGYKEGVNHLGIPVSHGCVRLGIGPAREVYDFVYKGTPILIHY